MSDKNTIVKLIKEQALLPLYFNADEQVSVEVLRALYRAGIRAVEYTNRGEAAFANFKAMVRVRDAEMNGLYLGIGTLKNADEALRYHQAGADFFISPGFVSEIAAYAVQNELLYAPGCMTPTEIIAAETAGVTFIKLFPGNALGPDFMKSIAAVFPKLDFMPTGGVEPTVASVGSWFSAGVCAVGMGSNLVTKALVDNRDFAGIEANTKEILQMVQSVKG
jgi:2-dehydro-3-deoxyphosphogluconate aldolase / (4S)-4-hydroxy-2-oxoglutarate aldolase